MSEKEDKIDPDEPFTIELADTKSYNPTANYDLGESIGMNPGTDTEGDGPDSKMEGSGESKSTPSVNDLISAFINHIANSFLNTTEKVYDGLMDKVMITVVGRDPMLQDIPIYNQVLDTLGQKLNENREAAHANFMAMMGGVQGAGQAYNELLGKRDSILTKIDSLSIGHSIAFDPYADPRERREVTASLGNYYHDYYGGEKANKFSGLTSALGAIGQLLETYMTLGSNPGGGNTGSGSFASIEDELQYYTNEQGKAVEQYRNLKAEYDNIKNDGSVSVEEKNRIKSSLDESWKRSASFAKKIAQIRERKDLIPNPLNTVEAYYSGFGK